MTIDTRISEIKDFELDIVFNKSDFKLHLDYDFAHSTGSVSKTITPGPQRELEGLQLSKANVYKQIFSEIARW